MQLTFFKENAQRWANGRVETFRQPVLFEHIVECLVPTAVIMNQRVAEKLTRMAAPVQHSWTLTPPEDTFEYRTDTGLIYFYDWSECIEYSSERVMRQTEIMLNEKMVENPMGKDLGGKSVRVCRKRRRQYEHRQGNQLVKKKKVILGPLL